MARETQVKYVVARQGGDLADGFNALAMSNGFDDDLVVDTIEDAKRQVAELETDEVPVYVRVTFEYFDTADAAVAGSQSVG